MTTQEAMAKNQKSSTTEARDDKPPMLGSWNRMYGVVMLELSILIALFYLFTKSFE